MLSIFCSSGSSRGKQVLVSLANLSVWFNFSIWNLQIDHFRPNEMGIEQDQITLDSEPLQDSFPVFLPCGVGMAARTGHRNPIACDKSTIAC